MNLSFKAIWLLVKTHHILSLMSLSAARIMKETNANRLEDLKIIHHITERINNYDSDFISRLMSEATEKQTFFAFSIVQFTGDLEPKASEDILSLYLGVWGLFRNYPGCRQTAITRQQFERVQQKNISMFNYLDGEDDNKLFDQVVFDDHQRLKHNAVMQYVSHCFKTFPSLTAMEMNDYCVQLIGIKSFIECFEELAEG